MAPGRSRFVNSLYIGSLPRRKSIPDHRTALRVLRAPRAAEQAPSHPKSTVPRTFSAHAGTMPSSPRSRSVSSPWRFHSERRGSAASRGVSDVDLQAVRPSTSQRTRPQGPKKTSPAWPVDTRKRHLAKGVEFRARGVQGVRGHGIGRTKLAEPRADAIFEFSTSREVPARAARPPERGSQDTCGPWPSRNRSPNQRPIYRVAATRAVHAPDVL